MAIDIQSLFSDIIETPAQRQQRMLTEGILKGRELTGGLTGLARTQAPLVSALSMQMPQRQEAMRRGVGGMLGLDVRTQSEKLEDIIKTADASTPSGMINLSKAIQEYAPAQALTLRQAAVEQQRELDETARQRRRQEEADIRAERQLTLSEQAGARAGESLDLQRQQAERSRRVFDNQMTTFEQSQEDREREQAASDSLKTQLINVLPPDSPYLETLKKEDAYIPLSNLRQIYQDYLDEVTPDVTIKTIFDSKTGKNMIVSIDPDKGEIVNTIAEAQRTTTDRTVPTLTTSGREAIENILKGDKDLKEADLYEIMGNKNLAVDLVHYYSEKNNTTIANTIDMIKNQINTESGQNLLRMGTLVINDSDGEWGIVEE